MARNDSSTPEDERWPDLVPHDAFETRIVPILEMDGRLLEDWPWGVDESKDVSNSEESEITEYPFNTSMWGKSIRFQFPGSGGTSFPSNGLFGRGGGGGGSGSGGGDGDDVDPNITLDSVGGLKEHIDFLRRSVMYPMVHKNELEGWGFTAPKGVMFHGPPGTGKTLLAKALANDIGKITGKTVKFFYHKGTQSYSKWVGESSANLQQLFEAAIAAKPSIIFFDEIDGFCPHRDYAGVSSQAYVTVVTTFLGMVDMLKRGEVFIIGATNRLESVDPAVRRPGRFDKELYFPFPDEKGRKEILLLHTSSWPKSRPTPAQLEQLGRKTVGYSGADLKKLTTDACRIGFERSMTMNAEASVIEEDWNTALRGMKRTEANVFGSSLFLPEPVPNEILLTLLRNDARLFIVHLDVLLKNGMLARNPTPPIARTNCFLVAGHSTPMHEIDKFHIDTLMQAIMNHPDLRSYTIYKLELDGLIQQAQKPRFGSFPTVFKIGQELMDTFKSSRKASILYIPHIDEFYESLKGLEHEGTTPWLITALRGIHGGQNHLVLASWNGKKDSFPELKQLFGSDVTYNMQPLGREERKAFFEQLFPSPSSKGNEKAPPNKKARSESETKGVFKVACVEECLKLTDDKSMGQVVTLYNVLFQVLQEQAPNGRNAEAWISEYIRDVLRFFQSRSSW